jgi:hypothetical protein
MGVLTRRVRFCFDIYDFKEILLTRAKKFFLELEKSVYFRRESGLRIFEGKIIENIDFFEFQKIFWFCQ